MSEEPKTTEEAPLDISNEFLGCGGAGKDTLCLAEAVYALAREVRRVRYEIADRLGEIRDQARTG